MLLSLSQTDDAVMEEEFVFLKDVERSRQEKDESKAETRGDYTLQENIGLKGGRLKKNNA